MTDRPASLFFERSKSTEIICRLETIPHLLLKRLSCVQLFV